MPSFIIRLLFLLFFLLLFLPETVSSQCQRFWWDSVSKKYRDSNSGCSKASEECFTEMNVDGSYYTKCYTICGVSNNYGGMDISGWIDPSYCSSGTYCNIVRHTGNAYVSRITSGCVPNPSGGGGSGGGGGGGGQTDNISCDITVDYVSPQAAWPVIPEKQQPGGYNDDWNISTIMVSLNKPTPPEGCTVKFMVETVKDSGEHIESKHEGTRPTGSIAPSLITFPGGSSGAATVVYTSSEVSGVEKIMVEADDGKVKKVIREEAISVRVPGLVELGEGEGYDLMPQPDKGHPYNHFGKLDTFTVLWDIAAVYFETENGTLRINDISLPEGGAFDICGKWNPKLTCATYPKGGHNTHRLGEDVDIDDETTERNTVTKEALEKIIKNLDYVDNVKITPHKDHFHLSILSVKAKKVTPPPPPPDVIAQ